jgi:hypothetical protein
MHTLLLFATTTTTILILSLASTARVVTFDTVYTFDGPLVLDEVWQFANVSAGDSIVAMINAQSWYGASVTLPLADVSNPSTAVQQFMTVLPTNNAARSIRSSCPLPNGADATALTTNVRMNMTSRYYQVQIIYQLTRNAGLPLDGTLKTYDTCTNGAASMVLWFDVTSVAAGAIDLYAETLNTTVAFYVEPQCNTTWFTSTSALPPYDIFGGYYIGYPNLVRLVAMQNKRLTLNLTAGAGRYYVHVLGARSLCSFNSTSFDSSRALFRISVCQGTACPSSTPPNTNTITTTNTVGTTDTSATTTETDVSGTTARISDNSVDSSSATLCLFVAILQLSMPILVATIVVDHLF